MNESSKKMNSTKRNTAVVVAIILVCILAIGGTIAYLTSHSELTNTFTVGNINPIDPDKPNPGPGGEGGTDVDKDPTKLNGNLYEPHWVQGSTLIPNKTIAKDPYVGVGPESEASAVYVYVQNTMKNTGNHIYFEINTGWEPVAGYATAFEGNKYTGGLFKYTAGLDASSVKDNNVWTSKPLFSNVVVSDMAVAEDFKTAEGDKVGEIKVQAFLHQSKDSQGTIAEETILKAVKEQFGLK